MAANAIDQGASVLASTKANARNTTRSHRTNVRRCRRFDCERSVFTPLWSSAADAGASTRDSSISTGRTFATKPPARGRRSTNLHRAHALRCSAERR